MNLVAQLDIDFSRVVEMSASKRQAIIEQEVAIGDIQTVQRNPYALAESLAQRYVEGRVARKVIRRRIAIGEARAVIDVSRGGCFPGKGYVKASIQRVSLIVVESEKSCRRGKRCPTAACYRHSLGKLDCKSPKWFSA